MGIHGNTDVDQEAKDALDEHISNCFIPYTDYKSCIMKYILKRWYDSWDQQIHYKLHEIHSLVGKTPCSYLLNNEERPECSPCNPSYSLKHVLLDCVDVAVIRQTLYNVNNLYDLFRNVAGDTILNFLKEID